MYVTIAMMKPGQKFPIFVNNAHLSDISMPPRYHEVPTYLKSLADLSDMGNDLKPIEPDKTYEEIVG